MSRNGRNNVLRGLPDLAKKLSEIVINRRLPDIYYSLFVFVKGRQFSYFYKIDKFENDFCACFKRLSSFLVFLCNTIMTNSDKHNNFILRIRNSKIQ